MPSFDPMNTTKAMILDDFWGLVSRTIQINAEKPMLVTTHGSMTFAEFNRLCNHLRANLLQVTGLKQSGVGVLIKDVLQLTPAMVAVVKSGNYVIPLDVGYPEATLQAMIKTAEIQVILTVSEYMTLAQQLAGENIQAINIDGWNLVGEIEEPVVHPAGEDVVQILFTSGSTGTPKGAIEDFRYLARTVYQKIFAHAYEPDDRVIQLSTFSYSAAHTLLFSALVIGCGIYYYNVSDDGLGGLPEFMRRHAITVYHSSPTLFRSLVSILKDGDVFPAVQTFHCGAEKRLHKDIEDVRKHFPAVTGLRLGFASTETQSVAGTIFPLDHDFGEEHLPSGLPRNDVQILIWDSNRNPLPAGQEGEIVIHGDALARGYINNPQLTAEKFIPDPLHPGWQYFRSGDLGMIRPDGMLVHLGRIDNMVKIKGVRIELASLESHLLTYPGVTQVATRAVEVPGKSKRLAVYFTSQPGINIPPSELRKHLAERFPAQTLPHYLVNLETMPLTTTGKIAISQLPEPHLVRPPLANPYVPASDELEEQLLRLWEEHIGIQGIGVEDDFFEVGGDSLVGLLLFTDLDEQMGVELPVSVLLLAPTVRKLAGLIRREQGSQGFAPILEIRSGTSGAPLFFIPGKGGYPTRIHHLAKRLPSNLPVYALQDLTEPTEPGVRSVRSVASFFVNQIQALRLQEPWVLVGESLGGKIVLEMASMLLKEDSPMPVVIMLDTYNMKKTGEMGFLDESRFSYYWMLLKKHTSIFVHSDWHGKQEYLRFYLDTGRDKIRRFFQNRKKRAELVRNGIPRQAARLEQESRKMADEYKPDPYPGRVILVKAIQGLHVEDPTNGWDTVELGELVVRPLECYHGSILFEPAVSRLAEIIQEYLPAQT
jgi:amino acid adenylation domain-containing protein